MMDIIGSLRLWFIIFLTKGPLTAVLICIQIMSVLQTYLAEELQKAIITKSKKRTGFKDIIWGADLADIQLISKFNRGFRFLLCVMDIFSKYAWFVPLKDKKR